VIQSRRRKTTRRRATRYSGLGDVSLVIWQSIRPILPLYVKASECFFISILLSLSFVQAGGPTGKVVKYDTLTDRLHSQRGIVGKLLVRAFFGERSSTAFGRRGQNVAAVYLLGKLFGLASPLLDSLN